MISEEKRKELVKQFAQAINYSSVENICNTPDFILAEMLVSVLESVAASVNERDKWYGYPSHVKSITLSTGTPPPPVL